MHESENAYGLDAHVAELYDQQEDYTDDVDLLRSLIGSRNRLRILEPFCGTGRVRFPLALDGHAVVGLDSSAGMLARAECKLAALPEEARRRITLRQADVLSALWPGGFDLILLGSNCLYELAMPEDQARCFESAAHALKPDGCLYVDNDHMEGALADSWRQPGPRSCFPTGTCADGTRLDSTMEAVSCDPSRRLVRFLRRTRVTHPDGSTRVSEFIQQKHPVSADEVRGWLEQTGFLVEAVFGDRAGDPYTESSPRAVFWARKR